jgi:hypothetical protein
LRFFIAVIPLMNTTIWRTKGQASASWADVDLKKLGAGLSFGMLIEKN